MAAPQDPATVHDVLAPGPAAGGDPAAASLVAAAARIADDMLRPGAEATDQASIVPRAHLDALADAGLSGLAGPVDEGGRAAPLPVTRRVYEVLAGACGVTFFVWVQHHAPVRLLAASDNAALRQRYLSPLCRGDLLGGVAFAYLRRPGPPAVTARRVPGGYVIDGEAPWVTSWGLADVYAAAALVTGDDDRSHRVLYFCLPGTSGDRLRPSPPITLAVMNASSTVRLAFSEYFVADGDVISIIDLQRWRHRDRVATAQPNPAAFGIATTSIDLISERSATNPLLDVGEILAAELARCREHSYGLADAPTSASDASRLDRLLEARAWSIELALRSAYALVAASGGRAMERSHPAQRLLREAGFFAIQAQTAALRDATLRRVVAAGLRTSTS